MGAFRILFPVVAVLLDWATNGDSMNEREVASEFTMGGVGTDSDSDSDSDRSTYCPHPPHEPLVWADQPPIQHIAIIIAAFCTVVATVLSLHLIYKHYVHFTNPDQQAHICRILLMVPIYSITSWCSLWFNGLSVYFDVFRDCYEAFVIWEFFALLISYLGGPEQTVRAMDGKPPMEHPTPLCCLPLFVPGQRFFLHCKRYILQYVFVQPLCAIATFIMQNLGVYCDGQFIPRAGYTYMTTILFVSVTFSMYFLVLFYLVVEEELKEHRPLPKFLAVKAVIFFSFWQSVLLSALAYFGVIEPEGDWTTVDIGDAIDNFVICVEMMIISLFHMYVFSYIPYKISPEERDSLLNDIERKRGPTFLNAVANPSDVWSEASTAFVRSPRQQGGELLKEFLSCHSHERQRLIIVHGLYEKMGGAMAVNWKKYYFYLLNRPAGLCWFESNPFPEDLSTPTRNYSMDIQREDLEGEEGEEGERERQRRELKERKGNHITRMYNSLLGKKKAKRWLPIQEILDAKEAAFSAADTVLEIVTLSNSYYIRFETLEELDRWMREILRLKRDTLGEEEEEEFGDKVEEGEEGEGKEKEEEEEESDEVIIIGQV